MFNASVIWQEGHRRLSETQHVLRGGFLGDVLGASVI